MKELAARRQLLVAESDIRRETLKLEVQNLQLYAAGIQQKMDSFRTANPLLMLAPLLGLFFGPPLRELIAQRRRRRHRWVRLGLSFLFSLRLYRQFRPLLRMLLARPRKPQSVEPTDGMQERETPAANI